jgi:hypothetical protein
MRIIPGIGLPAAGVVHRIFGILIVIVAVLIMLTAEAGRRPRARAMIFALVLLAMVATGCSAPAAGGYGQLGGLPAAWTGGGNGRAALFAVALAGLLFLAAARLLLLVFGPVARMVHVVTALVQAVLVIGLVAVVLVLVGAS